MTNVKLSFLSNFFFFLLVNKNVKKKIFFPNVTLKIYLPATPGALGWFFFISHFLCVTGSYIIINKYGRKPYDYRRTLLLSREFFYISFIISSSITFFYYVLLAWTINHMRKITKNHWIEWYWHFWVLIQCTNAY